MNIWATITVGPHDRPVVEVSPDEDGDGISMMIRVGEGVSLIGDRTDIERWVRDLAAQVAMQDVS